MSVETVALAAYPESQIEHELLSLCQHLRAQPDCPGRVDVLGQEGVFTRPIMVVGYPQTSVSNMGRFFYDIVRSLTVTWWGSEPDDVDDVQRQSLHALDWIEEAFMRGAGAGGPVVPIYDFVDALAPAPTGVWMQIEPNATITPRPDGYGLQSIVTDLRYRIHRGGSGEEAEEAGPVITTYTRKVIVGNSA